MLQNNHSLARPCPSCGAPLRIHSGRLSQKMQCPKCLDTIVLDPATAPVEPPGRAVRKKAPSRRKAAASGKQRAVTPPADPQLTQRYAELLAEHAELAERYADVVADYDSLVATHAELTMQLHALGDQD